MTGVSRMPAHVIAAYYCLVVILALASSLAGQKFLCATIDWRYAFAAELFGIPATEIFWATRTGLELSYDAAVIGHLSAMAGLTIGCVTTYQFDRCDAIQLRHVRS